MVHNKEASSTRRPATSSHCSPVHGGTTQAHGQRPATARMTMGGYRPRTSPALSPRSSMRSTLQASPRSPRDPTNQTAPLLPQATSSRQLVQDHQSRSRTRRFLSTRNNRDLQGRPNDFQTDGSNQRTSMHLGQQSQVQPQNLPNPHNCPRSSATMPLLQIVTLVDHAGFMQALGTAYIPVNSVLHLINGALQAVPNPNQS